MTAELIEIGRRIIRKVRKSAVLAPKFKSLNSRYSDI